MLASLISSGLRRRPVTFRRRFDLVTVDAVELENEIFFLRDAVGGESTDDGTSDRSTGGGVYFALEIMRLPFRPTLVHGFNHASPHASHRDYGDIFNFQLDF